MSVRKDNPMDAITIGWTKQAPDEVKSSNGKKKSQSIRRIAPIVQQQNVEQQLSQSIRSDKRLLQDHTYVPLPRTNFAPKSTTKVQIYNDKRLCSVRAGVMTFIIVLLLIIAAGTSVGIIFASIKFTNSTGTGNDNQSSFTTVSLSASLTSSISIGSQTGAPCSAATIINDPTRSILNIGTFTSCDIGLLFNASNGGSWIRFIGTGGSVIPLSSAGMNHCGAFLSGWSNDTLPLTVNATTNATVCFETTSDECLFRTNIFTVLCPGNYYVYFLPPVPVCNARYCTT